MKRETYFAAPPVHEFLDWLEPRLCEPDSFTHAYDRPREGPWRCSSLFDAYEGYEWRFRTTLPGTGKVIEGRTFGTNLEALSRLEALLRRAVDAGDADLFVESAVAVLRWGGVFARNGARLEALGAQALPDFVAAAATLGATNAANWTSFSSASLSRSSVGGLGSIGPS